MSWVPKGKTFLLRHIPGWCKWCKRYGAKCMSCVVRFCFILDKSLSSGCCLFSLTYLLDRDLSGGCGLSYQTVMQVDASSRKLNLRTDLRWSSRKLSKMSFLTTCGLSPLPPPNFCFGGSAAYETIVLYSSLEFNLKIFLKFHIFWSRYSYKIYPYRKEEYLKQWENQYVRFADF